jgi:hypothetical protein
MALNDIIEKVQSVAEGMLGKESIKRNRRDQSFDGFPCLDVGVVDTLVSEFLKKRGKGSLYVLFDKAFAKAIDRKLRGNGTVVEGRMTLDSIYLMTVYPGGKTRENKYLG